MAGKGAGGSQRFIAYSPQFRLEGGYTIFAQVEAGMDVARKLMPGDRILDVRLIESSR